ERPIRFGKIGAVAPILAGAEEEDLDTGESALLIDGEHVGLLDAVRIDPLMRLNRGKRGEAVAVNRRALEVERDRSLFHLIGKLVLDLLASPGQKVVRFAHQTRIIGKVDFLGAWSRTALDLIKKTRSRAAFKKWIAAGGE